MTHRNGSATKANSEILDRQPPRSLEAEQSVLGSVMLLPDVLDDVAAVLQADDFYVDTNRLIYTHLRAMHDARGKFDLTLLVERLKNAGDLERVGGMAYLAEVMQSVATAAHAVYYAEIVRDKATRRRAIRAMTAMLQQAFDESLPTAAYLLNCQTAFEGIESGADRDSITTADQAVTAAMDRIAQMTAAKAGPGLPTGFAALDGKIGGVFPGELVVIAARPGVGKTTIGLAIAHANAASGIPALFVSTEMSAGELLLRSICAAAPISTNWLRTGNLIDDDRPRIEAAAAAHRSALLFVDDRPNPSVAEIRRTAIRERREHGNRLLVVDYLQRLRPADDRRQRYEQVGQIVASLKTLARELNVPVIALAQLSRDADGTTPTLAHLRESGSIESEADQVWLLDRPGMYKKNDPDLRGLAVLNVAKNRNGETGEIKLRWDSIVAKFYDEDSAPSLDSRQLFCGTGTAGPEQPAQTLACQTGRAVS